MPFLKDSFFNLFFIIAPQNAQVDVAVNVVKAKMAAKLDKYVLKNGMVILGEQMAEVGSAAFSFMLPSGAATLAADPYYVDAGGTGHGTSRAWGAFATSSPLDRRRQGRRGFIHGLSPRATLG